MPHCHWKTTTFVGALTMRSFITPWVLDWRINRDAFGNYAAKVPLPELMLGDLVVMDNLMQDNRGCRRRAQILPTLQPRLQSNQKRIRQLKALLRKAAE